MSNEQRFGDLQGPFNGTDSQQGDTQTKATCFIMLHGWGADGRDLIDLVHPLRAFVPQLSLFCPHAPDICSANPFGRQWFALTETLYKDPASAHGEMDRVAALVEQAAMALSEQMGIEPHRIFIGGFSQGGMMSLHLAQRAKSQLAGYASIAGALLANQNITPAPDSKAPIFLAHGERDEVVPFGAMARANQMLLDAGYDCQTLARPIMGHSIDAETVTALGQFMATELAAE